MTIKKFKKVHQFKLVNTSTSREWCTATCERCIQHEGGNCKLMLLLCHESAIQPIHNTCNQFYGNAMHSVSNN